MKKTVLSAIALAAMTMPAFANECPSIMAQIDEAMQSTTADDATKASVMELYESGKAKHESGDHDGSVADLNAALELLGA
ncbi:hypothetical protein DEA8626_01898 [Defluviimonas aquaemixtae]|uniref:Uncharacterized protein n=1 Tax=Albidovulum aquaemixtae TaxID=1542388 RepID=A0A2R8B743_9RHOB|nr:hypothetical protein [Defluviimonas aquaemixtae]SPH18360.1 hypothetical protein DEA8626_01898 [Defluviimonas aquaemixtae]